MTEPPGRLLKLKDVERETSLSSSEIYRRMNRGVFPRPKPLGGRRVAWPERDIEEWKSHTLAESVP